MTKTTPLTAVRTLLRPSRQGVRWLLYKACCFVNRIFGIRSLNIGGGPNFFGCGWMNLEAVKGFANTCPFVLAEGRPFPVKEASISVAYSSHCFEHLDDKTAVWTLKEIEKALKPGGDFVFKIPDYDQVLQAWRRRDAAFFSDAVWGYEDIKETWKNRNVEDVLDFRAAMIFCGFWNDSYGDHYAQQVSSGSQVYHGPAVVSKEFVRGLLADHSPNQISAALSRIIISNEPNYHFNHRNAWSQREAAQMLQDNGFETVTFDKRKILMRFFGIPGIRHQGGVSMYCWARKPRKAKT